MALILRFTAIKFNLGEQAQGKNALTHPRFFGISHIKLIYI